MVSACRLRAVVVLLLATASMPAAAVTFYDSDAEPPVRLGSLQPMPEGLRAILAFYAMRASTGCAYAPNDGPLRCALTTALGFASQCSPGQLDLVRTWFRDGVPPIQLSAAGARAAASGDLQSICNSVPDTATHPGRWKTLRLDRVGDQIQIEAVFDGTSSPAGTAGSVAIETRYRVLADRIQVLKHVEKPIP